MFFKFSPMIVQELKFVPREAHMFLGQKASKRGRPRKSSLKKASDFIDVFQR